MGRFIVIVLAIIGVLAAFALRAPSPVGHWDSADGMNRYDVTYEKAFADMPKPAETRDVRTDHGIVRVYRFDGTGNASAPLVLLPGTASATPVWADNMPSLLKIGDVYTIDLLGEPGKSVQDRPIESDEDKAAWLHQALAALPVESVHLVGLSIGGWTAANLVLHDPSRVASLTLVDPIHLFDDMPLQTVVRSIPAAFSWMPKSWRDSFNSYTAGGAPIEDEPVADMIESGMKHYAMKQPEPSRIGEDRLREIDVPVLAIIAGRSVMHDSAVATDTAKRALRNGTVRLYPDASHAINGEYPDEVAADIARHVEAAERLR